MSDIKLKNPLPCPHVTQLNGFEGYANLEIMIIGFQSEERYYIDWEEKVRWGR